MALTDRTIQNAKPGERPRKLFDGGGLFLLLKPNGKAGWRLKCSLPCGAMPAP